VRVNDSRTARRQAKNSLIYLAPAFVGSAVGLITLPILTRVLTTADFGVWGLATAYGSTVAGIANLGMIIGLERNFFEARTTRERGELLYSVIAFVAVTFGICGVATWVARGWLAQTLMGAPVHGPLLTLTYIAHGVSSLKLYFLSYYKNSHDAGSYVRYTLDETLINSTLSVLLVVGFHTGVMGLAIGHLVATSVVLALLARRFLREVPFGLSAGALQSALRVSLPLTPRVLISGVGSQFDKYILGLLGTLGEVGVYTVGQRIANFVQVAMNALQNVYLPQVYERMVEGGIGDPGGGIGRYLTPYAYASAGGALAASLFAEEALAILASREFAGAALLISIMALTQAVTFFGRQPQLQFVRRMHLVAALSVGMLLWTMVCMAVGTTLLGAPGTALGGLVAGIMGAGVWLGFAQRHNPIRYEWLPLVMMSAPLAVAPVVTVLHALNQLPYPAVLCLKLALVAIFLHLGWRLGYLTLRRVQAAVGMVARRRGVS
jgi:O-antigen/teichoic acid export membrane protein